MIALRSLERDYLPLATALLLFSPVGFPFANLALTFAFFNLSTLMKLLMPFSHHL
jgi:hypothetical protein